MVTSGEDPTPWLAAVDFFWNEIAATNTISVLVDYAGGGIGYNELSVNVLTPTFSNLQNAQQAVAFGTNANSGSFGIYQASTDTTQVPPAAIEGNVFSASVSLPNNPCAQGQFGFLSLVNLSFTMTAKSGVSESLTTGDSWVLDDKGNDNNPEFVNGYVSGNLMPNTANSVIGAAGQAHDTPQLIVNPRKYPSDDWTASLSYTADFTTYLMYKAVQGAWVGLGFVDWSMNSSVKYRGPQNGTLNDYQNPSNWTNVVGPSPAVAQRVPGAAAPWFPEWDGDMWSILHP